MSTCHSLMASPTARVVAKVEPESGRCLRIGEAFRYVEKAKRDPGVEIIDGLRNFYRATDLPGAKAVLMEGGIKGIREVSSIEGRRRPAVLIRSSPHKQGSEETPWDDVFDAEVGHIRYFGDNKPRRKPDGSWSLKEAGQATGNRVLSLLHQVHQSPLEEVRRAAPPLLFFRAVPAPRRTKGQIEFQGYGLIDRIGMVSQFHPQSGLYFSNFVFDFTVLQLDDEATGFNWEWINARRSASTSDDACLKVAPAAWKAWVKGGTAVLEKVRRRVSRLALKNSVEQLPSPGSAEEAILSGIMAFYGSPAHPNENSDERTTALGKSVPDSKARFEALAELIAERVMQTPDKRYSPRWITRGSGDGGVDFVGRLTVGRGFSAVDIVVLGQAKCEGSSSATGVAQVARTVARLQRGWLGIYVTTSHFSLQVQQEVIEDGYPIVLVPGREVAETVGTILKERGIGLLDLLREVDDGYLGRLSFRRPQEALLQDHPDPSWSPET